MDPLITLLWQPQAQPKRGPRPGLTLEAIARAGIAAADADGLGALTMQGVAEALGVTKMALYRYVPGKTELVALMIDLAIGEPPTLPKGSWRKALDTWARRLFDRFGAHPWAIEATIGPRVVGPNELGWLEAAVGALAGSGLDGAEVLDVAVLLTGHVRNLVQQTSGPAGGEADQAMTSGLAALVHSRPQRFPALAAALSTMDDAAQGQALDFGLDRILDGLDVLIGKRHTR